MQIKLPFVIDPSTDKPSVSLSVLMISVLIVIVAFSFHIMGKIKDTSIALEFFAVASSLYFGRRFTTNKTVVDASSDKSNG